MGLLWHDQAEHGRATAACQRQPRGLVSPAHSEEVPPDEEGGGLTRRVALERARLNAPLLKRPRHPSADEPE